VIRTSLHVWRVHALQLWMLAAIVLAPLAVLEIAGYHFVVQVTTNKFDPATAIVNVFVILVFEIGSAEVEAVAAEKMVGADLHGRRRPGLRRFVHDVPWGRLLAATLLFEVMVAVGALLLVVPGVLVLVYFTLYGPAIVVEDIGVRAAITRSAQLVRGNFWRMLTLTAFVVVVGEGAAVLTDFALGSAPHWVHVICYYAVDVLLTPLQGVGIAVAYFALVELERAQATTASDSTPDADSGSDATRPAEAGPAEH
jgi:hypothetical protein